MMARILINELASVLSEKKKLNKKDATNFVNELFNLIQEGLGEDRLVKVKGLGTFKIIEVDDRESVNVNTGERVLIEGHNKISFTPDALMKELVNKPFSQFETVVLNEGVDFADMPEEQETPEESAVSEKPSIPEESMPLLVEPVIDDDESSEAPLVDFVESPTIVSDSEAVEKTDKAESVEEETGDAEPMTESEVVYESESESEAHEEIPEEEESGFNWKKWLLPLFFCIIVFAGGYLIGKYAKGQKETAPEKVEQKLVADVDTIVVGAKALAGDPSAAEQEDTLTQEVIDSQEKQAEEAVILDQYEKKDIRVQTGAYRIIGTDHLEKVKSNDNLTKICKRTIGPGMECYLEVFNDINKDSVLKPGMEIKIPKLELKKKKSQIQE